MKKVLIGLVVIVIIWLLGVLYIHVVGKIWCANHGCGVLFDETPFQIFLDKVFFR